MPHMDNAAHTVSELKDEFRETLSEVVENIKPKLRGYIHLAMAPIVLVVGIVLLTLTHSETARLGEAVFIIASLVLFSFSAIYHITSGKIRPELQLRLRKIDHSNINLMIAGTLTPFGVILLHGANRSTLLALSWSVALAGVALAVFKLHAPRWLPSIGYVALGWLPVIYAGDFMEGAKHFGNAGTAALILVAGGGLLYTVGALVYAFRPSWARLKKGWFEFHEIFHGFTALAFAAQFTAVCLLAI